MRATRVNRFNEKAILAAACAWCDLDRPLPASTAMKVHWLHTPALNGHAGAGGLAFTADGGDLSKLCENSGSPVLRSRQPLWPFISQQRR